ncbi:MAG: hypothetical protein ACFFE4_10490 [Candidatus Thorarchaeota archaeon]
MNRNKIIIMMAIGIFFISFIPDGKSLEETHYLNPFEKMTYNFTVREGDQIN